MSHITDLIRQLCPNGIEFKALGSVIIHLRTGLNPRKNFELNPSGAENYYVTVRELSGMDVRFSDKTDRVDDDGLRAILNRAQLKAGDVLFSATGTIGRTALVRETPMNWGIKEGVYAITPKPDELDSKYLIYLLGESSIAREITARADGSTVVSIPMASLRQVRVPVPPLKVQREIVRVLDSFRQLEAELEAELEARGHQYAHYRRTLLTYSEDIPRVLMGDVLGMRSGKFVAAANINPIQTDEFKYPCYGGNGLRGYVASPNQEGRYVLVGRQGALSGNVKRVSGRFYATEHAVVVTVSPDVDVDWVFHMLTAMNLNQYVSKGAQPGLAVGTLNTLEMPLPPLDEQRLAVGILDKLDALVNDPSSGLPAELNARRTQYEYYRDLLLTFEEAAV